MKSLFTALKGFLKFVVSLGRTMLMLSWTLFEEDNILYLNLEQCARGLGFIQEKNGTEYVRWDRVNVYLADMGFSPQVGNEIHDGHKLNV